MMHAYVSVPTLTMLGFLFVLTTLVTLIPKVVHTPRHNTHIPVLIWMSTTVSWLILGIEYALILALLVTPLAIWLQFLRDKAKSRQPTLHKVVFGVAAHCLGLLVAHGLHGLLGGHLPLVEPTAYANLMISLISVVFGFVTMYGARLAFTQRIQHDSPHLLKQYRDFVWMVPLQIILPLIFFNLGYVVFCLAMLVACGQIVHQYQLRQTEYDLEKHIGEIQTLKNISEIIDNHGTAQDILETAYVKSGQLLTFSVFFVAIYERNQGRVNYPLVYEQDVPGMLPPQLLEQSFVRKIIEDKQPLRVSRHTAPYDPIFQQYPEANTFVGVPLVAQHTCLGVLGAVRSGETFEYDQTDEDLLMTLAGQLGLALYYARLNDESRRMASNFSLVNRSLQTIMFNIDSDNALETTCEVAQKIVQAQKVAIFLYDLRDSEQWEVMHHWGFDQDEATLLRLTKPLLDIENPRQRQYVSLATIDTPEIMHFAQMTGWQSMAHIPLQSGHMVVGYLGVYHDTPYIHSATDLETLQLLGGQLASALDNAEVLRMLEGFAAEQAQLVHLSRISGLDLNLERVVVEVCRQLAHMLSFAEVLIGLYDDETQAVMLHTDGAEHKTQLSEIVLQDIPEFREILRPENSHQLLTFHMGDERHSMALQQFLGDLTYQSLVVTALPRDDATLGVLILADYRHHKLNESQRRLLEVAKHQIAANIQNAQIHTFTEKALIEGLEQLALIEDMAQRVSSTLSLETIVDNLLDAALMSSHANLVVLKMVNRETDISSVLWQTVVGETVRRGRDVQPKLLPFENEVLQKRAMRRIINGADQLDYLPASSPDHVYQSALIMPLMTASQVFGTLTLASYDEDTFTHAQSNFIKGLVGNASASMEHILLLNQREEQIETLTQLRQLSLESATVQDLATVQQNILRAAMHILDGNIGGYYKVKRDRVSLIVQLQQMNGELKPVQGLDFPLDAINTAVQTGHMQTLHITNDSINAMPMNWVVVPIRYGELTRAVICIGAELTRTYEDLGTVSLLAVQAANHLENAILNDALHTQNKRMRVILDSTRDGIIFLDREGRVQDANAAASTLLGMDWQHHQVAALAPESALLDDHESWHSLLEAAQDDPTILHQQEFHIKEHDQIQHLKTLITPVLDVDDVTVGHLLIFRDITDEKSLDQFRVKMQDMMLHDLRSPLTAIISSLYLSQEYAKQKTIPRDSLTDILDISVNSATNLLQLLDSLRNLPEMRRMLINPVSSSFGQLAHTAQLTLSAMLEAEQIRFSYDLQVDDAVFVDRSLIHRILINLLNNAFNYTPTGGEIRIATEPATDDHFIRILVADTGPGIPPEMQQTVFEQFVQGDDQPMRDDNKGMGLGLYFCKMAVEAHGGKIEVVPDGPLSGACIAFTLPRDGTLPDMT